MKVGGCGGWCGAGHGISKKLGAELLTLRLPLREPWFRVYLGRGQCVHIAFLGKRCLHESIESNAS